MAGGMAGRGQLTQRPVKVETERRTEKERRQATETGERSVVSAELLRVAAFTAVQDRWCIEMILRWLQRMQFPSSNLSLLSMVGNRIVERSCPPN